MKCVGGHVKDVKDKMEDSEEPEKKTDLEEKSLTETNLGGIEAKREKTD